MNRQSRPSIGAFFFFAAAFVMATYFTFAAVQGDFGLFQRVEIEAEARDLAARRNAVNGEIARMENLVRRLSDNYLDLDLLDQQARSVLGLLRADELVIR